MQDEQSPVATQDEQVQLNNQEQVENLATSETLEQQLEAERKARKELEEKNKKLYARAKQAEAEKYELKQSGASPSAYATKDEVDEMYLASKGYSEDELKSFRVLAKGTGKRLRDVVSLPEAEAIITHLRNKAKSQGATPPPSQHVSVPAGQKPWSEMSASERKENYTKKAEEIRRRGRG